MKFKSEKISYVQGKWTVTVDGTEWTTYVEKATVKLKKNVVLPGFRKNKIPDVIFRQHISQSQILKEAHRLILSSAYDFATHQNSAIQPISTPSLKVKAISPQSYVLEITFDIIHDWKIKKYTGITTVKKPVVTVSGAEINAEVQKRLAQHTVYSDPEIRKTMMGDLVTIDFQGFINKKPFANGTGKNFQLLLGSKSFIAGFEEQLIGVTPNEKITVNVTLPQDYFQKQFAQQKAVFQVTVKAVQTAKIPKLDATFFRMLKIKNMTASKFKASIKKDLMKNKELACKNDYLDDLCVVIAKDSHLSLPESLVDREVTKLYREFQDELKRSNINLKQYKKRSQFDDKKIDHCLREDARGRLYKSIIFQEVAKLEDLNPTTEQIRQEYSIIAQKYNVPLTEIRQFVNENDLKARLRNNLIADFLFQHNGETA